MYHKFSDCYSILFKKLINKLLMKAPGRSHKKNIKSVAFNSGNRLEETAAKQTNSKSCKYSDELNFANAVIAKLKNELAISKEKISCLEKQFLIKTTKEIDLHAELESLKFLFNKCNPEEYLAYLNGKPNQQMRLDTHLSTKQRDKPNLHSNKIASSRNKYCSAEKYQKGIYIELKECEQGRIKTSPTIEESFFNDPSRCKVFNLSNFLYSTNAKHKLNIPQTKVEANDQLLIPNIHHHFSQESPEEESQANSSKKAHESLLNSNDSPLNQIINDYDIEVQYLDSLIKDIKACQSKFENTINTCSSIRFHDFRQDFEYKFWEKKSECNSPS